MDVTVSAGPDLRRAVVAISGEWDGDTVADLRTVLHAAAVVYEETVVDLTGLDFFDGDPIVALAAARDLAGRRGHRLRLLHLTHTPVVPVEEHGRCGGAAAAGRGRGGVSACGGRPSPPAQSGMDGEADVDETAAGVPGGPVAGDDVRRP